VILSSVRHLQKAEITVQFHDRQLVCVGSDTDPVAAIHQALDKLEQQAIKVRAKWRDTKRTPRKTGVEEAVEAEPAAGAPAPTRKVFKVNHHARRKPMTLDEAMLEMESDLDYLVYRDADSDRISVLMRRRDGNFDLLES
jgi:putative sigma-54 modulation protein